MSTRAHTWHCHSLAASVAPLASHDRSRPARDAPRRRERRLLISGVSQLSAAAIGAVVSFDPECWQGHTEDEAAVRQQLRTVLKVECRALLCRVNRVAMQSAPRAAPAACPHADFRPRPRLAPAGL